MNLLRPTPIPCTSCGATAQPRTYTRTTDTELVTEARWHCTACGKFIKQGTVAVEPLKK